MALQRLQDGAAIVIDRGGIGLEQPSRVQGVQRLRETPLLGEDDAAIVVRLEIRRLNGQQLVIGGKRFVGPFRGHQGMGVVGPCHKVLGLQAHGLVQQAYGFVELALLRLEEAQPVQGLKVRRIGTQQLAVQFFRLGEPACGVRRQALLK